MPLAPKINIDDDPAAMVKVGFYDNEFPLLKSNGLYAAQTTGDGDCLFHSLSDQLYGHEGCHHELRQRVVDHLRNHAQYFKSFIDVAPVRRAPRRRAAASSRADLELHSQAEIDKAFEHRLQRMQNSGVFGDNLEIQAFAREFGVDVKIYLREYAYVIKADNGGETATVEETGDRPVVHIAYHMWEHYSSIRNRDGPHTGLPLICLRPSSPATAQKALDDSPIVLPWMEEVVSAALPHFESPDKIREALQSCNGDVNDAVFQLLDGFGDEKADLQSLYPLGEVVLDTISGTSSAEEVWEELSVMPTESVEEEIRVPVVEAEIPTEGETRVESTAGTTPEEQLQNEMNFEQQERREPDPTETVSPTIKPTSIFPEFLEVDAEYSRVKRRKSPDGTPVNISLSTINDDTSSISSSFSSFSESSSVQSSSSSESDVSITDRRRRKPTMPTPQLSQPARRSPRIRARTNDVTEKSQPPPTPTRAVPRRKPRFATRVRTVTVGIRELYV